jgi:apolipoprotein N-acyltransferase
MSASRRQSRSVAALLEDNAITSDSTPEGERVSGAALVGLWLLIPVALGAVSFAVLGITELLTSPALNSMASTEPAVVDWRWWLGLTIALQVVYWLLIAPRPITCLWAVLPVIALIPTFFMAREVLLVGRSERGVRPSTKPRFDTTTGKAIWIEPVE